MLTETNVKTVLDVPESDSEYPPELVELWRRNAEFAKVKIAAGEMKYKTVRELAAERGINID